MPHIHDKIDFTVETYIVYKNKVLLRRHDKLGYMLSVGGHIELDENPNEAAIREVKEEVGLDIELVSPRNLPDYPFQENNQQELIPPWYSNMHDISDTHKHISLIYFAKAFSDNVIPENDTDEWKWFTKDEIQNSTVLLQSVSFYALQALDNVNNN
jgi:ADP-ribose pyrophosphatase YjhB (NUDIX family)